MGITSFSFLCFYTIVLALYYILPKKQQWVLLLIASVAYFVLALKQPLLLLYPAVSSLVCYLWVLLMERYPDKKQQLLVSGILLTLASLILLKYVNFGVYTYNATVGRLTGQQLAPLAFLLPLGISFYTFSMLGYLIDAYYGIGKIQKNYFKFLLFGIYFPVMISGPILSYREDGGQLFSVHRLDYRGVTFGMQRMAWGFFKKLVISERLAVIVNTVYGQYTSYSGFYIWLAAAAFVLQLYTDFSGCMDIVLGISETFGICLPENFKLPFSSTGIAEFWRRWHITLGKWMKDYVFYPILRSEHFIVLGKWAKGHFGKKTAKRIPTYLGMLVLWFTVGLWHGGAWKFIVGSGLLHCVYIILGELCSPAIDRLYGRLGIDGRAGWMERLRQIRTFLLVAFSFIFFRADSFLEGTDIIRYGFCMPDMKGLLQAGAAGVGLDAVELAVLALSLIVFTAVSHLQKRIRIRETLAGKKLAVRWCVYYMLLFAVILWGYYGPGFSASEFIYQGF